MIDRFANFAYVQSQNQGLGTGIVNVFEQIETVSELNIHKLCNIATVSIGLFSVFFFGSVRISD